MLESYSYLCSLWAEHSERTGVHSGSGCGVARKGLCWHFLQNLHMLLSHRHVTACSPVCYLPISLELAVTCAETEHPLSFLFSFQWKCDYERHILTWGCGLSQGFSLMSSYWAHSWHSELGFWAALCIHASFEDQLGVFVVVVLFWHFNVLLNE